MKTSSFLLFASTTLSVAIGLPALASMRPSGDASGLCSPDICAAALGNAEQELPLIRVSGDDEDDDGGWARREHDEDDDDDCEDDGEDDDGACTGAQGNPAPAGTVAPPANGLFGSGKPPIAVTN